MLDLTQSTGHYVLELDGVTVGLLKEVRGGAVGAPVIEELTAPGPYVKKHLGTPVYEDLVLELGFGMSQALYDWIEGAWERKDERKNGAIIFCDANMEAKSRRVFRDAAVAETILPMCDTGSHDPAYLTLRLTPEYTRSERTSGKVIVVVAARQKVWLPSNFRLSVDGLDCSRVSRISPVSSKQRLLSDPIGELRDFVREPGRIDFSNLRVTIAEAHAQSWIDWHEDFLVNGNRGQDRERHGTLELLAPNLQDVLTKVQLRNVGIFRLAHEHEYDRLDGTLARRVVADLYCEGMEIEFARGPAVTVSEPVAAVAAPTPIFHVDPSPVTWPPRRV